MFTILTQNPKMILFEMLRTSTSLRKKKLHTRKHFKKLVFRVFHVLERKVFFSMMDDLFIFGPKMVAFHDFWSKSMKTKEKHWFSFVFHWFWVISQKIMKCHHLRIEKNNIIHHRKKKLFFLTHGTLCKQAF